MARGQTPNPEMVKVRAKGRESRAVALRGHQCSCRHTRATSCSGVDAGHAGCLEPCGPEAGCPPSWLKVEMGGVTSVLDSSPVWSFPGAGSGQRGVRVVGVLGAESLCQNSSDQGDNQKCHFP